MEPVKHPEDDARYVRKDLWAVELHITFIRTFFCTFLRQQSIINRDNELTLTTFSGQLRSQPAATRAAPCSSRHTGGRSQTLRWRSTVHSRPNQPGALRARSADGGLVTNRRPGVDRGHGYHSGARPRPPPVPRCAPGRDREHQVSPPG